MLQRTARRANRVAGSVAEFVGRRIRTVPAVASAGCAWAGSALLWGAGWAWLTGAAYLLVLAREVN